MRATRESQQLARRLFRLSLADGQVSAERVGGVLAYLAQHPSRQLLPVLKYYHRLVAAQVARNRALVEHAGAIDDGILRTIAAVLAQKYRRPVTAVALSNPRLIAGLRIRIGDDVYESTIVSQLAALVPSA
ncbi:MAG TPA: F0F1 ATP synthase subunit delta [Opitutaceae bacterium]|nr:F0F1 ATP synthase subunit delta [Opitutaceae bacterium]